MTLALRPYQDEGVAAALRELEAHRSTIVVWPTGAGKTVLFARVAAAFAARGQRTLFLAHREELIRQAVEKLAVWAPDLRIDVEMAESRATVHGLFGSSVVVASVQSITRQARLTRFPRDWFGLVVVDECHHATAASYHTILDHFAAARVLGVTATPDRGDETALGLVFESVAHVVEIRDAIESGWLCPVRQKAVIVDGLDLSRVRTTAGDLNEGDLERVLTEEEPLHRIAQPIVELAGTRKTLVFCATVEHARQMSEMIARYAAEAGRGRSTYLHGGSDDLTRSGTLREFAQGGPVQYLCNCALFTEGFDAPHIECVAVARPTKSRAFYSQCLDARTEVLTERGWRGIDDAIDGRVAAFDVATGRVGWSIAARVERLLGDEPMYGIESPHTSVRVTAGHRMVVMRRAGRDHHLTEWGFCDAAAVPAEARIPVAGSSEQPDAPLSDAEVSFLGLLLTDGNFNPRNNAITLYQSERHPEVIALIDDTIRACGFKCGHSVNRAPSNFGPRSPLHRWTISRGRPRGRDRHLTGWGRLAEWVSADGKSLMPAFETISSRQARILLAAMDAGNGSKHVPIDHVRHTRIVSVANARLADEMQSLFVRRGLRCTVSATPTKCRILHVSEDRAWSLPAHAVDGRPTWGIVPGDPRERVWCVTVDTGAIVTRRRGKVAIVGNCIGRGTRMSPGKADLLVLDFAGNAGRHALVSALDVLDGNTDPAVRERAAALSAERGDLTVLEALDLAAQQLADEEREAAKRRARITTGTRKRVEDVDPFVSLGIHPRAGRWGGQPPTERQLAALAKFGFPAAELDKGQAHQVLDELIGRAREGRASYKQARVLMRYGLDPDVSFDQASKLIDVIAANRWTRPEWLESTSVLGPPEKEAARA